MKFILRYFQEDANNENKENIHDLDFFRFYLAQENQAYKIAFIHISILRMKTQMLSLLLYFQ